MVRTCAVVSRLLRFRHGLPAAVWVQFFCLYHGQLSLDDVSNIIEDGCPNEETGSEPRPSLAAAGRQRFGAGLRPGLLRHTKQKGTRNQRLKKNIVCWTTRQRNTMQATVLEGQTTRAANSFDRKVETGKGKWKRWTAPAVLRAGFSSESATPRQIASSSEGSGQKHAGRCRFVTASGILEGQNHRMAIVQQIGSQGGTCSPLARLEVYHTWLGIGSCMPICALW